MNCEGDCIYTHGEHRGRVRNVRVTGNGLPWGIPFAYCDNARIEDLLRGYTVDIVDPDEDDDDEERGNNPPAEPQDDEFDILEPALG